MQEIAGNGRGSECLHVDIRAMMCDQGLTFIATPSASNMLISCVLPDKANKIVLMAEQQKYFGKGLDQHADNEGLLLVFEAAFRQFH
jgi:hypothetical protein